MARPSNLPGKGPGRPKGARNKITRDIKEAILRAFEEVGGHSYLSTQAVENPQAFMALLAKVLPTQISGDPENPLVHEITIRIVRPDHRDS